MTLVLGLVVSLLVAGLLKLAVDLAVTRGERRRRPHRVDNPVHGLSGDLPEWGTWAAALERVPASVRADFLPVPTLGELLSDDGWQPAGALLVPDDVYVTDLAHGTTVLRVPRAAVGQIRFSPGGPVLPATPRGGGGVARQR